MYKKIITDNTKNTINEKRFFALLFKKKIKYNLFIFFAKFIMKPSNKIGADIRVNYRLEKTR